MDPTPQVAGDYARNIRTRMTKFGRGPNDVLCFASMKIITAGTETEARTKYDKFYSEVSYVATLALISGWTGIDFSQYEPDQPVDYLETNAARTILHRFCATDSDRRWTLRDIAAYVGMGGVGPVLVGAPEQIADQLEAWTEVRVDGFNLSYSTLPNSYVDFIQGVAPVLQRPGRMQSSYRGGTLRHKLFERASSHMPLPHPAAARRPW